MEEVEPFLFNLFYDPAIIRAPNPVRYFLAKWISKSRLKEAQENYHLLGGASPLLENTRAQQNALQDLLGAGYSVHVLMRYATPRIHHLVQELKALKDLSDIVFVPLYPQFSTSTTASSLKELKDALKANHLPEPMVRCCYPTHPLMIEAWQELILDALKPFGDEPMRILFSAHGLPEKFVKAGDPYPRHVEATVKAVMRGFPDCDYGICYQSRVGPLKWIGPSIEESLQKAAQDKLGVLVVPIAFVSEHSETLVELDMQYGAMAQKLQLPFYKRVATLSVHPKYIEALSDLVSSTPCASKNPCQKDQCWGESCMNF